MPRKPRVPYVCPCCGYSTSQKSHMVNHLNNLIKPCPRTLSNTELTDEVKEYVLTYRVYIPAKEYQAPTHKPQKPFNKKKISHALRVSCWNKYIGEEIGKIKCLCCNSNFITQHNFHCGHVLAEAHGGTLNINNLRPICAICNNSMGTVSMKEYAWENFNVQI